MPTGPTVFLVDDNADLRHSLEWLLVHAGFKVETYISGEQFLKRCRRDVPGCVVLNVEMTLMSSRDVQQQMTAEGWGLPVVALTSDSRSSAGVGAIEAGAFTLVEKPFRPQDLVERVREALDYNGRKTK